MLLLAGCRSSSRWGGHGLTPSFFFRPRRLASVCSDEWKRIHLTFPYRQKGRVRRALTPRLKRHSVLSVPDEPKLLMELPTSLASISVDLPKDSTVYSKPSAYIPWVELNDKRKSFLKMYPLPSAVSSQNMNQYQSDRTFELKNLPELPMMNNPSKTRLREKTRDHMDLSSDFEKEQKPKEVSRYMDAVVEGLRSNPHISLARKRKIIAFYEEYFTSIDFKKSQRKHKSRPDDRVPGATDHVQDDR